VRTCTAVITILLGSARPAPLVGIERLTVTCPACGHAVDAFVAEEPDGSGGIDRDLFERATGPQPEFYRISTCPACLYSGYLTDFTAAGPLAPYFLERLLRHPKLQRPAGITPQSDPRDIHPLDRYDLAIACYRWRQCGDEAMAWLNLRASWVARDAGSVCPRTPRLERIIAYARRWEPPATEVPNPADRELHVATLASAALAEGRFNPFQAAFMRLYVGMLLRRHGENLEATAFLRTAQAETILEDELRQAARRALESIERERRYQREALTHLERAWLSEQVAPANRGPAAYVLGELNRRLGRDEEAMRWYGRVAAQPGAPDRIRLWAQEQERRIAHPMRSP